MKGKRTSENVSEGDVMGRFGFDRALLGLAWLGLLGFGAWTSYLGPAAASGLQAELSDGARLALDQRGFGWARVSFDGMDATVTGEAPTPEQKVEAIAAVRASGVVPIPPAWAQSLPATLRAGEGPILGGVNSVADRLTVSQRVSPYTLNASVSTDGALVLTGHVPDETARDTLIASAETLFPGRVSVEFVFADGAPEQGWVEAAQAALGVLAACAGEASLSDTSIVFTLPATLPEPPLCPAEPVTAPDGYVITFASPPVPVEEPAPAEIPQEN
jgi:hypothetical protein